MLKIWTGAKSDGSGGERAIAKLGWESPSARGRLELWPEFVDWGKSVW